MPKLLAIPALALTLALPSLSLAYGEGPSSSGRWVEGQLSYSDGSKCGGCSISLETNNGFSKTGYANSSGYYKIYVASRYIKGVYTGGYRVWSGSRDASGGTRIDVYRK